MGRNECLHSIPEPLLSTSFLFQSVLYYADPADDEKCSVCQKIYLCTALRMLKTASEIILRFLTIRYYHVKDTVKLFKKSYWIYLSWSNVN